jgi:hypothetical protein
MLEVLQASGPHPDHAERLMLFGQFVGAWDFEAMLVDRDGTRTSHRGEWHFGWALDGRAVQDVLISPPVGSSGPAEECGTTVRFYDPELDAWHITWITPLNRRVRRLVGRPVGDEIRLEGENDRGELLRWTFSEITPESFTWRGHISDDGGATWRVEEEMRLRRRGPGRAEAVAP